MDEIITVSVDWGFLKHKRDSTFGHAVNMSFVNIVVSDHA